MKSSVPVRGKARKRRARTAAVLSAGAAIAGATQVEAAVFNVTNAADNGSGSLRQAVLDANAAAGDDSIVFDSGVAGPIVLTTGQIDITDSLTITGPGSENLTVSGNDASRIFYVYQPLSLINVTITGLTLTDGLVGAEDSGGAIVNYGESLTLEEMTVVDSVAGCCGGGIASFDDPEPEDPEAVWDPNVFILRNSTVSGNEAGSSGGGLALYILNPASTALVENVTVSGNIALFAGGGIDVLNLGSVTVRDSRIIGNDAVQTGGGISTLATYSLDIENTTISENTALNGGGIGGFYVLGMTIDQTTISGNTAGIPDGASPYNGGGFFAYLLGDLAVTNSTISGNSVAGDGGGFGVYYLLGDFLLQNSTVSGNQATHPFDGYGGGISIYGVYEDDEGPEIEHGAFRSEFSTITGNVADVAGGIYLYQAPEPQVLISTVIAGNTAATAPDAVGSFDDTASFIGDPSDATFSGTPMTGDPMLGPLADNGGPTLTHMPLGASPLLNAGANPSALTTDQRGTPRVREFPAGSPDIGSVEVQTGDGPSVFDFDPVSVAVGEGAGTTDVIVRRTNSSGAASVDVVVTGGTADGGGVDYTFSTVTVEFADLETASRAVPIGIVQDAFDEANETIELELQNPENATVGAQSAATVTILDDEAGTIQFDPASYSVNEADGTANVTVTRTGAADVAVSADVVATAGSATGGDFSYTTQTVSWAAGETGSRNVSITIVQDTEDEPDETVDFALENVTGGPSVGAATAELTIVDDDEPGALQFDQAAYAISEDGGSIQVTVTRTGGSAGEVTVEASVLGGTAMGSGTDYTFGSVVLTWPADDATPKSFSIPITDDSEVEVDETINLQLENATGNAAVGAQSTTTVTILDEDSAGTLQFAQAAYAVSENGGSIDVTITRTGGSDGEVTADVTVAGGTATGADYTLAATTTLTWADGDATPKTVSIPITDDSLIEPDETINLQLENATNSAVVGAQATTTVTILDDDSAGTLQFAQAAYAIAEDGGSIDVTVTRTGGSDGEVTVDVSAAIGTATGGGVDYTLAPTTTLTWADGDATPKTVSIPITDDSLIEPDETINLQLENATNSAVVGAQATTTVTILDDDSAGALQFAQAAYAISEDGGSIDVTVTRTGGSDGEVTVDVSVAAGGTASGGGVDYTLAPTTLTWADGDATPKTVSIPITDDSLIEPDETINLQLENATNSAVIGAQATTTVTIEDEDAAGALGFDAVTYTVNESDGTLTITVNRQGGSDGEVTVDVVVTGGTATDGGDFTLGATTLVWPEGDDAPKSFTITIVDDGVPEPPETIVIELQNPTGGATISEGETTVTIIGAAAAGAAAIPTLDGWMRIVMAGMLAMLAIGVIRRGRFLASVLLAMFLLSSSPALAAGKQRERRVAGVDLKSMESEGDLITLELVSGETIRIDTKKVRIIGSQRRRARAKQQKTLAEGEKARVRVWRSHTGEVLFVTVIVGDFLRKERPAENQ